jgi:hypothetical protein
MRFANELPAKCPICGGKLRLQMEGLLGFQTCIKEKERT